MTSQQIANSSPPVLIFRDHSNFVNCVRFSPDGSKFITVSSDKKGILYDAKTAQKIGELSMEDGHKGSIYAVSWSPDSKQVSLVFQLITLNGNYIKMILNITFMQI